MNWLLLVAGNLSGPLFRHNSECANIQLSYIIGVICAPVSSHDRLQTLCIILCSQESSTMQFHALGHQVLNGHPIEDILTSGATPQSVGHRELMSWLNLNVYLVYLALSFPFDVIKNGTS